MRRIYLSLLAASSLAACNNTQTRNDANAPAVEPGVVDTRTPQPSTAVAAVPARKASSVIPSDSLQRVIILSQGYGLITAMMVLQDAPMLSQMYDPKATLTGPDSTVTGSSAVVRQLIALAKAKSLKEFQRTSRRIAILDDSTLADSGTYVMVLKRSPTDSSVERGSYAARWRARADAGKWVILEDYLRPGQATKAKGAR
jgi:hypothetical protein